jgi:hypothetical protein
VRQVLAGSKFVSQKEGRMSVDIDEHEMRELDCRTGEGLEVTLLWSERTGEVVVSVDDRRTEESFRLAVDPAAALDAFRHPYSYGRRRRSVDKRAACERRRLDRVELERR